ncbi:hypothetical protein A2950_01485 [Candidatus Kaiserbacteria bacterium RIFCSPLOWO2_01_FULL_55_19]|uniref:Lipoprotein n=1 Tax=Candidatus Kaiserbacteria bacterium RIFCSPLOWO2_01_FULL_55_19 TaxID=1798516 RepID=A0A1F6ERL7_9BACT|nr:MAG: hypothetical protein A2950_01485 [Candidatus Kaiserbacteria bacterium RIFCSPLOWO2_01_FULL_55_19]
MRPFAVRFLMTVAASILLSSCATTVRDDGSIKQCSDTPRNAVVQWFRGVAETSIGILRALIPDGASIFGVFDNKGERGQEIVRQILANPVSGENDGCACTLFSVIDDTSDPHTKIVTVKRMFYIDDDRYNYTRAFRVRFNSHGNCIVSIESVDPTWNRIE